MQMNLPLQLKNIRPSDDPADKLRIIRNLKKSLVDNPQKTRAAQEMSEREAGQRGKYIEDYEKDIRFISREER